MAKIYKQFISFLVESSRKNAESKGIHFDERKSIRKHEAVLPLIIFYILAPVLNLIAPNILSSDIYLLIIIFIILRGLNHYFGWIRVVKD
tara:strand:+ start:102 stop:371 length:270 start_codon:yes stop_codon:yes gene_type:complete